jgi:hypothetical protein
MNSSSKPLQFCVLLASGVMLCGAAAVWSSKSRDIAQHEAKAEQARSQRRFVAASMLFKSFTADNQLSYSALSHTVAYIGGKSLESTAQVSRAPHHLIIKMLSGPMRGVQSGYSERWSWRQETDGVMHPSLCAVCCRRRPSRGRALCPAGAELRCGSDGAAERRGAPHFHRGTASRQAL